MCFKAILDALSTIPTTSADPPSVATTTATTTVTCTKHQSTHTDSVMANRHTTRSAMPIKYSSDLLSKSHCKHKQEQKYMTKKRKKKPKPLTDKQRAAAARKHYELHHMNWMSTSLGHSPPPTTQPLLLCESYTAPTDKSPEQQQHNDTTSAL